MCASHTITPRYVSPEHRGRGVGTELVRATFDVARELGAASVRLQVDANNAAALRLYRACGFRTTLPRGCPPALVDLAGKCDAWDAARRDRRLRRALE